jgi:hypothetical protein
MTVKGGHHSPEARAKIARAGKGRHLSPETKAKLAIANAGNNNLLGYKHSPESRAKMSASHVGRKYSPLSPDHKAKIAIAKTGGHHTPETKAKISSAQKGKPRGPITTERWMKISGEKSPMWKGGLSFEPYCPKFNRDLKKRIRAFFNHQCVICGKTTEENTKSLACHHVEYNKRACCDGMPVHFATLCACCHTKTNHDRSRWEEMMHRIIDEIYNGKSYFTKEEWRAM